METIQKSKLTDVVLWHAKPAFGLYVLHHLLNYRRTLWLVWIGLILFLLAATIQGANFEWQSYLLFISVLGTVCVIDTLLKLLQYRNTRYWLTRDALYISAGIMNKSVTAIPRISIIRIDMTQTSAEKKQGAGTILIDDGETRRQEQQYVKVYKKLISIKSPEEILRLL